MMNENILAELGSAAAGIAHDLNNQLTLILNYLDAADTGRAREAANRCASLTGSLLSLCRGEIVHPRPVGLSSFLSEFARGVHLPGGVELHLEFLEPLPPIMADPLALSRVLVNLISNACDAMRNRGSITIRAYDRTIEVVDSGPGVAPELLGRIFEPLFTTKGAKGNGLGLAIVREIMRQHGGCAFVRNGSRHGAIFSLRFPGRIPRGVFM